MEKKSVLTNQASRIAQIKTSIAIFECRETNYNNDFNEINYLVANCSDTIIARLIDKLNDEDNPWYLCQNGRFEIQDNFQGYLPNLNNLVCKIVKALE